MACTGHACLHRPQRIHSGLLGFSTGLTTIWQAFAFYKSHSINIKEVIIMNQNKALELTKDIATDIIGGILIAVGVYNFAAAAKFPMVGVNGIALIFYQLFGLPIGTVALILNIPIAICCFRLLGRRFFLNSVRTIIITSIIMDVIAPLFPVYQGDRLLSAICCCVLS